MDNNPPLYPSSNGLYSAPPIIDQPSSKTKLQDNEDIIRRNQRNLVPYHSQQESSAQYTETHSQPMPNIDFTTFIVTYPSQSFGSYPQRTICPYCRMNVVTVVVYNMGIKTHLCALLCCLLGCIPCAILPYCMPQFQNKNHYCPACGAFLGQCRELQ